MLEITISQLQLWHTINVSHVKYMLEECTRDLRSRLQNIRTKDDHFFFFKKERGLVKEKSHLLKYTRFINKKGGNRIQQKLNAKNPYSRREKGQYQEVPQDFRVPSWKGTRSNSNRFVQPIADGKLSWQLGIVSLFMIHSEATMNRWQNRDNEQSTKGGKHESQIEDNKLNQKDQGIRIQKFSSE